MMLMIRSRNIFIVPVALIIWFAVYYNLKYLSDFFIDSILKLNEGNHFTESLRFFVYEVPKVLLLLILIIFVVGIIRSYFTAQRTRKVLEGKKTFTGNVIAAGLGS